MGAQCQGVAVIGTFNDWDSRVTPMQAEEGGYWYAKVAHAGIADQYKYAIDTGKGTVYRIDPYAHEVTNSAGNGVIHDPSFNWGEDSFSMRGWNELVIYELHVGTFNDESSRPGKFMSITARLEHLKRLGINAIQIMPVSQFAGMRSWGYNPSNIFAVDSDYGGSLGFKQFIKESHAAGIAVILDVVYNHFGPSDLDLWRFDGWCENDQGGIYFYNDHRALTPWGQPVPITAAGKCVNTSSTTCACGSRSTTSMACASTARCSSEASMMRAPKIFRTVGACCRPSMKPPLSFNPAS